MLGLPTESRVIDLFDALMRGDIAGALKELRDQYDRAPIRPWCSPISPSSRISSPEVVPAVADDRSLAGSSARAETRVRGGCCDAGLARCWCSARCRVRPAAKPVGCRDGAGADRLCGRSANAGRGDPHADSHDGAATARPPGTRRPARPRGTIAT
jgi:hypothetical protein